MAKTSNVFKNLPLKSPLTKLASGDPEPTNPIVLPDEIPEYIEPVPPIPVDPSVAPPVVPDTPIPPPLVDPVVEPHQPIDPGDIPVDPVDPEDPDNPLINPLDPRDPSSPRAEDEDGGGDEIDEPPEFKMDQLEMLKNRARLMGINFSNNIGVEALNARIKAKLDGETVNATVIEEEDEIPQAPSPATTKPVVNAVTARQKMINDETKLVRLRITNLDPKKKDLPGEIFTVANKVLGAIKKYIPYGEATDNGYHVPYVIYRQLREREFLNIKTRKDNRGRTIVESSMSREFALEILPPLTQTELHRLAASQAAASGMSD